MSIIFKNFHDNGLFNTKSKATMTIKIKFDHKHIKKLQNTLLLFSFSMRTVFAEPNLTLHQTAESRRIAAAASARRQKMMCISN